MTGRAAHTVYLYSFLISRSRIWRERRLFLTTNACSAPIPEIARLKKLAKWNETLGIEEVLGGKLLLYPRRYVPGCRC